MTISRAGTAEQIINRAAVEIGLSPQADPYSSNDESFKQLRVLLNTVGEELCLAHQWEFLTRQHQIITVAGDTGDYELPDDFLYMIPQTGWERNNETPLNGSISAQDWTYLQARNLASTTIYASFRIREGRFSIFPQPPPENLDITFEYQSKNWVLDTLTAGGATYKDEAQTASDQVLFDKVLCARYLKVKYLEAKGLDSGAAKEDMYQTFSFITGHDKTGQIINAGGRGRGYPLLHSYRNVPHTNYGF